MTAFDYILLFVLGCSLVIGTMRGFLREMLSLAGWVVAFIVANMYSGKLTFMLPSALPGETLRFIVAFMILFIAARLAMMLFAKAVDALICAGGLSGFNRFLGCVFGLARGIMISLVLVLLCGMTAVPRQPFWRNALFSPYAEQVAMRVLPFLPVTMAEHIAY